MMFKQDNIDEIVKKLNDRPMKCLGYLTSKEVFNELKDNKLF